MATVNSYPTDIPMKRHQCFCVFWTIIFQNQNLTRRKAILFLFSINHQPSLAKSALQHPDPFHLTDVYVKYINQLSLNVSLSLHGVTERVLRSVI